MVSIFLCPFFLMSFLCAAGVYLSDSDQQFERMKHLPGKLVLQLHAAGQAVLFHVFPAHLASRTAGTFFENFQYQGGEIGCHCHHSPWFSSRISILEI
jgi:hypothetical protein